MYDAMIIGGSSGMGLATAKLLKEKGLSVLAVSRSAESNIDLKNAGIASKNLDIKNEAALEIFLSSLLVKYLIVTPTSPLIWDNLENLKMADARAGFEKFWHYLSLAKMAVKKMQGLESITFVTGAIAHKNVPGTLMPKIVNNAINEMVKSLALEIAPIRMNAVSPGLTDTPFIAQGVKDREQALAKMALTVPLKRIATAREIAEVITLAALNQNMTGAILDCDGGSRL